MNRPKFCTYCGSRLEDRKTYVKYDAYTGDRVLGLKCVKYDERQAELDEESLGEFFDGYMGKRNLHDLLFDEL